jgi:hypothetical protein
LSRELAPICAKNFINRFYLILLNSKILIDVTGLNFRGEKTNVPLVTEASTTDADPGPARSRLLAPRLLDSIEDDVLMEERLLAVARSVF